MKAFICVYRHPYRDKNSKAIQRQVIRVEYFQSYIKEYSLDNNFYDWGDDPSFFMSTEVFGDYNHATWGFADAMFAFN
jgi:hypothetical protein